VTIDDRPALILHRPHSTVDAIIRQLTQIGLRSDTFWPEPPPDLDMSQYGLVMFDADMGYDAQFPWPSGAAPMPAIALIGSEAPGRIAWAIRRGADAHLLKPVAGSGIYSAVLIARGSFERRCALQLQAADLALRLSRREAVAAATALLMTVDALSATEAFGQLRRLAMAERLTIEAMADRLLSMPDRRASS